MIQHSPKSVTWWQTITSPSMATLVDLSLSNNEPQDKIQFWETSTQFSFHTFSSDDTITPCVIGKVRHVFCCRTDPTVRIRMSQLSRGFTSLRFHRRVHNTLCERTTRGISNDFDFPPFPFADTRTTIHIVYLFPITMNPILVYFALSHLRRLLWKIAMDTNHLPLTSLCLLLKKVHMALPRTSSLDTCLIPPPQRGQSFVRSFCSRPHMKPHDWTHTPFSYLRLPLSSSCMCDFLTSQSLPLNPFGARPEVL